MGWSSGGNIFDSVAQALLDCGAEGYVLRPVLGKLIDQLQAEDWDTEDESVGRFRNEPVIVELFMQRGVGRYLGTAGVIDYDGGQWLLTCDECGRLDSGEGDSAREHDRLVRLWAAHDRERHGGDGIPDRSLFIEPEVAA